MQDYVTEEIDVLVIGAGAAGLWAAIRAADFAKNVVLVEKGKVGRSGISTLCHVYMGPLDDQDAETAMLDTIERSTYLADQTWIRTLAEENNNRFRDMEDWGVIFEKNKDGKMRAEKWSRSWKVQCRVLAEGKQVIDTLRKEALKRGVRLRERVMITDLLTSDGQYPTRGRVAGAVGLHTRSGQWLVFKAKAVVISSGGISGKLHLGYADGVTGDGQAMAFRAGAELAGMELSPSNSFSFWNRKIHTGGQAQFQIDGARLINRTGEEFLKNYKEAAEQFVGFVGHADFGDLCRAIAIEIIEGRGPVYFDLRKWSRDKIARLRHVLPVTMAAFDDAGIEITKEPIETTPVSGFYGMSNQSGLKISPAAETAVPGLFAAGAVVMVSRGVIPQALCTVVGYRAGESSGKRSREVDHAPVAHEQVQELRQKTFLPLRREAGMSPELAYYLINKTVTTYGGNLFKAENRIRGTLARLREIAQEQLPLLQADDVHGLIKATEVKNFALLMELLQISALERKESRLEHYREDYPYRDDKTWLKWICCRNSEENKIELRNEAVPLIYTAPDPPAIIPSPIQFKLETGG